MAAAEKEISFKEFVNTIIDWIKFLFSKWLIIGIIAAIGAGLGVLYAFVATPGYSASLTFVLSNKDISGGSLMGLASQFGFNMGSSGTDAFSGDNIITLMNSRKMVQEVLMKEPDGRESLLNTISKDLKLDKAWAENERTQKAFPFPDDTSKMTLIQDSLFREVFFIVQENMLTIEKPEKDQSIYVVTTTANNEMFAYYFTNYLVDATSAFYIATKTSSAKRNLDMLQKEADSIRSVLGGAIVSTGAATDLTFNLNPAYQVQRSGAQQGQVRAAALGEAYGEVLKNLELAKITVLQQTPLYQVVDEPALPLLIIKPGKLFSLIVGGFLGAFLIIAFLTGKRIISAYR
ncbi:MAG: Wzz/FepE/Etk N-terminal domain-containing protein [Panacibacter sp.]